MSLKWPSGLRRYIQSRQVTSSNSLGARLDFGTQPRYETPGDLSVGLSKT